jgi:hypothetical protein
VAIGGGFYHQDKELKKGEVSCSTILRLATTSPYQRIDLEDWETKKARVFQQFNHNSRT